MTDAEPYARDVLTIAVLSILLTAPVGAIGISVGGPRLLSNEPVVKVKKYNKKTDQKSDVAVVEDQL